MNLKLLGKRSLALGITLALLVTVMPGTTVAAAAQTDIEKYFEYVLINNDTEVEITGYHGYGGDVIIPSTIDGKPVTSIGSKAFYMFAIVTSVTIPDSVKGIKDQAFRDCTNLASVTISGSATIAASAFRGCTALTSVTIGSGTTSIGSYAFSGCTALESVTIPDSVTTIGSYAFSGCTALASVIISDSATSIGDYAFQRCIALASVNIPDSVTSIGSNSFYGCTALASVIIGSGVTTIGAEAFYGCTALTSVTIPSSVTSIGSQAFYGCTALASINAAENNQMYTSIDGVLYNKTKDILIQYPGGKAGAFTVPNHVKAINSNAFQDAIALTSVTIPDSVIAIGSYTFRGCTALATIEVGANNPNYASEGGVLYNKTKDILIQYPEGKTGPFTIPDSVESIGMYAFYGTALTSAIIPDTVESIGGYAFQDAIALTSVTLGSDIISIGRYAFNGCTALTSVSIPSGVESIGSFAFQSCTALTSINVADDNPNYASVDGVLYNKDKTTLIQYPGGKAGAFTVPNSVTTIGSYAFDHSTALTSVTIPNSVTTIGWWAFRGCTALASVTISGSATSIGIWTFQDCTALTSVTLGSVKSIGNNAFNGCTALTSVSIPSGVGSIGSNSFYGCTALTSIDVAADNPKYASINGVLYSKDQTTLVHFPAGKTGSFVIPSSVTNIGSSAFYACTALKSVIVPSSVTSIGDSVFYQCPALAEVRFDGALPTYGSNFLFGCASDLEIVFIGGSEGFTTPSYNGILSTAVTVTPDAPQNLQATADAESVKLTWEAPSFTGGIVIGYVVYYGTSADDSTWTPFGTVGAAVRQETVTGLQAGTAYYFGVKTMNSAGTSVMSNYVTVVPYTIPDAPKNLQTAADQDKVTLTWTPPSSDGSSPITEYKIYRGSSADDVAIIGTATTETFVDTEISAGERYYYRVSAVNSAGESDRSYAMHVTTPLPDKAPLTGKIVDSDGKGIKGITVKIEDGTSITTGDDGSFTLQASQGTHTLTISGEGRETKTQSVNVDGLEANVGNIAVTDVETEKKSEDDDGDNTMLIGAAVGIIAVVLLVALVLRYRKK